jgi:putative membrane protein
VLASILTAYALAQAGVFALVAALVALPSLRVRLTPGPAKSRRVREAAMGQLAAASLAAGSSRAAVVIFAAEAERRVEILATEAAHAAVGQATWDAAVAAVLDAMRREDPASGFIAAAKICGEALAKAFPQHTADPNALPDRPLEF